MLMRIAWRVVPAIAGTGAVLAVENGVASMARELCPSTCANEDAQRLICHRDHQISVSM